MTTQTDPTANHADTPTAHTRTARPLRVALVSHSDALGGAAVVTYRLMQALRLEGIDARMVVFNKLTDDPNVLTCCKRARRGFNFMWERMGIALANGISRKNLFKVSSASTGVALHRHPWVRQADIVVLGWVNQGLLSLKGIQRIADTGKPVIWTMHDMWNLTGMCHHAYECRNYRKECGNCKFLAGNHAGDLSHKVWKRKKKLYESTRITFVAVSNWLADRCRNSSLMKDADIRVIHNAFPVDSFFTRPDQAAFDIGYKKRAIVMGAARLDDPIKGLPLAIEALNDVFDNHPEVVRDTAAIFFGDVRDASVFDNLRFPYRLLGTVSDPTILRRIYAGCNVVMSSSLYETLPGTLIEGLASGCLPVSFGMGGQSDIIDHKVNGYIARYKDTHDLAEGLVWALNANVDRDYLHENVRERFASTSIARKYMELFDELLEKQ